MKLFSLVLCFVPAALYAWTLNPLCLFPLVTGLVAFGVYCLKTRLEASARLADPDHDRKVKEWQLRFAFPGLGVLALVVTLYCFAAEGWTWSLFWSLAFGLYCFWLSHWELRRVKRQNRPASS
jgi:hypothetical protein